MMLTGFRTAIKVLDRHELRIAAIGVAAVIAVVTLGSCAPARIDDANGAHVSAAAFHAELSASSPLEAGTPVLLTLAVKDSLGRNTGAIQIVHQKPMHLMIVSDDLADFFHIHPMLTEDNVLSVTHVFPHGGDYRLFADFTPVGGGNHIESFSVNVQGAGRAAIPLPSPRKPQPSAPGASSPARRSPSTSRTATSRTSSGSSPTSAASTWW